ncbi:hypothetical protein MTO96_007362 [Rhipicephalus appendiculatus]
MTAPGYSATEAELGEKGQPPPFSMTPTTSQIGTTQERRQQRPDHQMARPQRGDRAWRAESGALRVPLASADPRWRRRPSDPNLDAPQSRRNGHGQSALARRRRCGRRAKKDAYAVSSSPTEGCPPHTETSRASRRRRRGSDGDSRRAGPYVRAMVTT